MIIYNHYICTIIIVSAILNQGTFCIVKSWKRFLLAWNVGTLVCVCTWACTCVYVRAWSVFLQRSGFLVSINHQAALVANTDSEIVVQIQDGLVGRHGLG